MVGEVGAALTDCLRLGMERSGLDEEFFMLDPGIGFAKTAEQSLALLRGLDRLVATGLPVFVGASRKSFIGHTLGLTDPAQRLPGSLGAAAAAWARGARALRVHDVAQTRQLLDMLVAIDG